jgi:hypothetical protein
VHHQIQTTPHGCGDDRLPCLLWESMYGVEGVVTLAASPVIIRIFALLVLKRGDCEFAFWCDPCSLPGKPLEPHGNSRPFQCSLRRLGLFVGYGSVRVAMNQEERRITHLIPESCTTKGHVETAPASRPFSCRSTQSLRPAW